jgi:hypothetical protein
LWVALVVGIAIAGDFPLLSGAPAWFASRYWGYVPLGLVVFYFVVAPYRRNQPASHDVEAVPPPVVTEAGLPLVSDADVARPETPGRQAGIDRPLSPTPNLVR